MARIDIVLPVFNEEQVLERSIRTLHAYLGDNVHHDWQITIADNGSRDRTAEIAQALSKELSKLQALHIPEAGRGRALTSSWLASDADVLVYMDIDLSTELDALPRLISSITEAGHDIATGSRLGTGSETTRSLKREVLSRGFVLMTKIAFQTRLSDTQCGFKAITRECAQKLLPLVKDTGWFWDTELLLLAAKGGWSIASVPVRWVEDRDSRVKVTQTVWRDLKGLARLRFFDWKRVRKAA